MNICQNRPKSCLDSNIKRLSSNISCRFIGEFSDLTTTEKKYVEKMYFEIETKTFGADAEKLKKSMVIENILSIGQIVLINYRGQFASILKCQDLYMASEQIFFIRLMASLPEFMDKCIVARLVNYLLKRRNYRYISFRTQTPKVYQFAKAFSRKVYPQISGRRCPKHIRDLGQKLFEECGGRFGQFNSETFVEIAGFREYPSSKDMLLSSRDKKINGLFTRKLDIEAGDSFLVLGALKKRYSAI